jgi:carbon storage regulator
MLIIRRRTGESILIGEDIELHVVDISPSRVKIGIAAPPHVLILRKEIQLARQQNLAAVSGVSGESIQSLVSRFFHR